MHVCVREYVRACVRSCVCEKAHGRGRYDNGGDGLYKGKVANTSQYFLDHNRSRTYRLWEYVDEKVYVTLCMHLYPGMPLQCMRVQISKDRRASYKSEKYPWIEMAGKYEHLVHKATDFDGIRVEIPGHSGPGHYIGINPCSALVMHAIHVVHWRWKGPLGDRIAMVTVCDLFY